MKKSIIVLICLIATTLPSFSADLATYKKTYEKSMGDIVLIHGLNVTKLNVSYNKSLKTLADRVRSKGDLEKLKAVTAEIERFKAEKAVVADNTKDSFADLKKSQLFYIKQKDAMDLSYAKKIMSMTSKYDGALAKLQKNLTIQNKVDDATAVVEERKAVKETEEVVSAKAIIDAESKKKALAKKAPTTSPKKNVQGVIDLESAMEMFVLDEDKWSIEEDHLSGKSGYTERFRSKPFKAKNISFGLKIQAKWYHGILVSVDGKEAWYSHGHLLNEKAGVSIDDKWEWIKGRVEKPDEFVPISLELKGNTITWHYDGKKIKSTKLSKGAIKGERDIVVGFACHATDFQVKDFYLKK